MLTVTLVLVAFVAGVTGTWSPCGFSIIDTISAPRRQTTASCVAFTVGACAGGFATFALLATIGTAIRGIASLHPAFVAPVIAVAAAIAEARNAAILPQIRRQVPEHWRRILALPVAVGLYGVLLGLGFTTFVLTFAFWALVGLTVLLATPLVGVAVGIAFGVGRALPVALVAPVAHLPFGRRVVEVMAQRPALVFVLRRAEAVGMVAIAVASFGVTAIGAATKLGAGTDPSTSGSVVVWTARGAGVERDESAATTAAVPAHAAVGGSMLAWRDGETVHVAQLADLTEVFTVDVPGVDAIAVSDTWLATRARAAGADTLTARPLSSPDDVRTIATAARSSQVGRPALDGDQLVYHVASPAGSRIVDVNLTTSKSRVVRRSASAIVTNPSVLGGTLVYDRQTDLAQLVEIGPLTTTGRDRVVYRVGAPAVHDTGHEPGYSHHTRTPQPRPAKWTLWTTALSASRVYVTLLPRAGSAQAAQLVSVSR